MINMIKRYSLELICIIMVWGLGMFSGMFMQESLTTWYPILTKPSFQPPNWIFGPVWGLLYTMLGIVLAKLWKKRQENPMLLKLFIAQMILNYIWTPIFFGLKNPGFGLYSIAIMWSLILIFLIQSRKYPYITLMTLPYFIWVSFAMLLNYQIFILN